jgi:hypothetical protein
MFRGNVTQFTFGVDGGINRPVPSPFGQGDTFQYTGRGDFRVTPWLNVTPDFQIIRPGWGAAATDEAFVYGLRVNMKL